MAQVGNFAHGSAPPVVLVVDDHRDLREAVRLYFELAGYSVLTADNGSEAVALCRDDPPDVIIMDVGMPVLDGVAATAQLKASPQLAPIPVIGFTAHAFDTVTARAKDAGMHHVLVKGGGLGDLLTAVDDVLRRN